MTNHVEIVSQLVEQLSESKQQLLPAMAKVVVQAIQSNEKTDDLLQVIGAVSGHGLKAEDLLIAIRNELSK